MLLDLWPLFDKAKGTATGNWEISGTATGVSIHKGTASGSHEWSGSTSGASPDGANGAWEVTGTATGKRQPKGSCVGSHEWSGTCTGYSTPVPPTPIGGASPHRIGKTWKTPAKKPLVLVHHRDEEVLVALGVFGPEL